MRDVEKIRGDKKVNNNSNDNHCSNSSRNGGITVMMTKQEKPLETYDDIVQEIEQEIIMHEEDIGIMEEVTPGALDGYFRTTADNKDTQRDSVLD